VVWIPKQLKKGGKYMYTRQIGVKDSKSGVILPGNSIPGGQESDGGGGLFEPAPLDSIMGEQVKSGMLAEVDAAAAWGVARGVLREIRENDLQENVDWMRINRVIYLSENGVKKISEKLGMEFDGLIQSAWGKNEVPLRESVEVLSTARNGMPHFPNHRLVKYRRGSGEEIMVVVRRSHNYRPRLTSGAPMTIEVQCEGNTWIHYGRDPREPGKW
jgi:hypothetical protein